MYELHINALGTIDTPIRTSTSRHHSLACAYYDLERFARGYEILSYGTGSGTINTQNRGGATKSVYSWRINHI